MSLKPMLSTGNMSQPFPLPGAKSGLHVPPLQFIRWPWAIGLWGQWKKDIFATNIWLVVFISNIVKGKYKGRLETENHQSNSIFIDWHFHIFLGWILFCCKTSIPILAALIPSLDSDPIFIAHVCWLHPYSLVKSSFGLVNFIAGLRVNSPFWLVNAGWTRLHVPRRRVEALRSSLSDQGWRFLWPSWRKESEHVDLGIPNEIAI